MQHIYYPAQYRSNRPYLKEFLEQVRGAAQAKTLTHDWAFKKAADLILKAYPPEFRNPEALRYDPRRFTADIMAALCYAEWLEQGAALYDFDPTLTGALRTSGLSEIRLADVKFPFVAAYFHFGPQPGLTLQSGAPVTGAYLVYSEQHSLRVALTAPLRGEVLWPDRFNECYDLRIPAEYFDLNIEQAIDRALADDIEDLRKAGATLQSNAPLKRISPDGVESFIAVHRANNETYRACIQLIISGLCYVTTYTADTREQWQVNTPEKLQGKAELGTPKERERARGKLNAMGYRKVWLVGREFAEVAAKEQGGPVSPHWRKGHWRNQPYGSQMSLRRLVWIRPTRVLGGSTEDEARVYEVRPQTRD